MRHWIYFPTLIGMFVTASLAGSITTNDSITAVAKTLTDDFRRHHPDLKSPSLAILPFSSSASPGITDQLTHEIKRLSFWRIVERTSIEKILSEQHFQQTGFVNPADAVKIGKLIGAQYLLLGSVQRNREDHRLEARIVSVEEGTVITTISKDLLGEWSPTMSVQPGSSLKAGQVQEIYLVNLQETRKLDKGLWVAGKGFAKVNGGSSLYFLGSSTPPQLEIEMNMDDKKMLASCEKILIAGVPNGKKLKLTGYGKFRGTEVGGVSLGLFYLSDLQICGIVAGH